MEKVNASENMTTESVSQLIGFTYQEVVDTALDGARRQAANIPTFAKDCNGCVRIGMLPLCEMAEVWLGGTLSRFPEDVCMREFSYPIFPGGSRTVMWRDPKDDHIEPVNCYGYSALKVAGLMSRRKLLPTECQKYLVEENGYSEHAGVIDLMIKKNGENFLWIFICTSGAKSSEDKQCSVNSAVLVSSEHFAKHQSEGIRWEVTIND